MIIENIILKRWGSALLVQCLTSMHEAPNSISSTTYNQACGPLQYPDTWETEAGELEIQDWLQLKSKSEASLSYMKSCFKVEEKGKKGRKEGRKEGMTVQNT